MSKLRKAYISMKDTVESLHRSYNYRQSISSAHDRLKDFPQPELTPEEIAEIDLFWKQFGIRFKDYSWFQMFYGMTGIKSPMYIPQEFYLNMVLPYYNNSRVVDAYKDKNAFELFVPKKFLPATVMKRINGDFYDPDGGYITNDVNSQKLIDCLSAENEVIVKNAMDSGRGQNVRKYSIKSPQDAAEILKAWTARDYVVQKGIKQHPFFAQFNKSSVNIIRVNTWYHEGRVEVSTPVLRFGMPGYATDVCYIDGKETVNLIGVTDDGYLRDKVVDLRGEVKDLNAVFPNINREVPSWQKIVAMISEGASRLKQTHIIGWDVTVTEEGEPKVIEYNILVPSTYSSQVTDGPMWGQHTEALLAFLKDKKNQEKYIPKKFRSNR